ncbi:MAG: tetratricopeptide repeat protein [Pseudomonadota bacterium]
MPHAVDPPSPPPAPPEQAADLLARFLERQGAGDIVGALPVIEELAALLPDNTRIQAFLGFTLERLDRPAEALAAYTCAVTLDPGYVDALHNRACLLARLRDPGAEAGFTAVLAAVPDHAGARAALRALRAERLQPAFDRARTLEQAGDRAGAEAAYRAILTELPDNVPVLQNLAGLLAARDPQQATELWECALGLEPDNLDVRASFGQFLFARGRVAAALPHLETVVARRPDDPALAELIQAKADLCAWDDVRRLAPRVAAAIRAGAPLIPMAAVRFGDDDPALIELAGRRFMRHVLDRSFPDGITVRHHARPAATPDRLRIGYLSSDLRGHIIGLLLAAVIERHDRARFDVHVYGLGRRPRPSHRADSRRGRGLRRRVDAAAGGHRRAHRGRSHRPAGRVERLDARRLQRGAGAAPGAGAAAMARLSGHQRRRLHRLCDRRTTSPCRGAPSAPSPSASCGCPAPTSRSIRRSP